MRPRRALAALAALALLAALGAGIAQGERTQHGNLIISLDGGLKPLQLPRKRPAPVSVRLAGGLQTSDGEALPRVTRIELGIPSQGVVSAHGLPVCTVRRIANATVDQALEHCGDALVGHGGLSADVFLPTQEAFKVEAELLAFNGRVRGQRAVLLYGFAPKPPTVVVLPFLLVPREGRFNLALVGDLPSTLGPWPHLASFELTLGRRYVYRGRERSYLSATCPIPPRLPAGIASLAQATLTLADGRRVGTFITRGCRAR